MDIERIDDVAVVRMREGKGNAMGSAWLRALREVLDATRDASAVVLTGDGRFFSAGLALPELFPLERDAMRAFMHAFEEAMVAVHAFERPIVAAIDGHAIAGGCVLALACDRRLMASGAGRIGLSEATLGIGLPPSAIEPLRALAPGSIAPIALEGRLFGAEEARATGLVDEVVDAGALPARALEVAKALGTGGTAAAQIRRALRAPVVERMRAVRDVEIERWLDTWLAPATRARIAAQVARLSR